MIKKVRIAVDHGNRNIRKWYPTRKNNKISKICDEND